MIVIMAGLPGSGKTTLCRELAPRLSATVLDKDQIRSQLFSPRDIEYSTEQDDFCLHIMLETSAYILGRHPARVVFFDGRPFSRSYQLQQVVERATGLAQSWRVLECVCSEPTAKKRLGGQAEMAAHSASNRDYSLYLRIRGSADEIPPPKTVIDTDQDLASCVAIALKALAP
jgi:adenylylsulfate kinase